MRLKAAPRRPALRARLLRLGAMVVALAAGFSGVCAAQGLDQKWSDILTKEGIQQRQTAPLIEKGIQERRNGQYDESIQTLQKALDLSRRSKFLVGELSALGFLSLTYREKGEYKKVLELRLKSLKIVRGHPDLFINRNRNEEPWELGGVSGAYVLLKDFPNALKYARAAVDSAIRFPSEMGPVGMGRQRQQLGILLFLVGEYKEAERYLRLAYDDFEQRVRDDISAGSVISNTYDIELGLLRWLQRDLIAQGRTDEALEVAERSRSTALAALVASRMGPGTPRVPQPPTLEQIKDAARLHNATLVEYSVVYEYDPDLLLEFSDFVDIRAAAVFAWVIKPDGSISFRQTDLSRIEKPLNELVAEARSSIGARGRGAKRDTDSKIAYPISNLPSNPALRALDRILIEPIRDQLPTNVDSPLVFIPQDTLFLVPFAALQDESGRYVVEKHTLLVAISVATLTLSAEQQRRFAAGGGAGVLVVGNPAMPSLRGKVGQPLVPLPDLPAAEQEAMEIAELFSARARIGSEATKVNVMARMPTARILHFATHGLLDRDSEYLSALALAPTGGDAGFLTMGEIEKMKLSAELAVLSACDTAQGKLTGDGVLGFSRAFMVAGVPSLVVSLWAIPDAPTAMLMTEFYKGLLQKRDKAQALRQAMLLTMEKYPDPGSWAAFELIGENSTSEGLLAAKGESPAVAGTDENADNAGIVYTVPEGIWNFMDLSTDSGGVGILFSSAMSIAELVQFYREAYSKKGLREVKELTQTDQPGSGQLVFRGSWKDRELVIQMTDMSTPGATPERVVSTRFERNR